MAIYRTGNLLSEENRMKYDEILITTNNYIKSNGCLCMGRGIAKTVLDMIPAFPAEAAKRVKQKRDNEGKYGVIINVMFHIGLFQVKDSWQHPAKVELIINSTRELVTYAIDNPTKKIGINMPGIGYGQLSTSLVLPIVATLPNNVEIWTFS